PDAGHRRRDPPRQPPAATGTRPHRRRRGSPLQAQRGEVGTQLVVVRVGRHRAYAFRSASIGRNRAARHAGPKPPAVPITSASRSANSRSAALTRSVITLTVKVAAPKP